MKCQNPRCESTELVYSGTDAFVLGGIPTEKYCYTCAAAYVVIDREMSKLREEYLASQSTLTTSI